MFSANNITKQSAQVETVASRMAKNAHSKKPARKICPLRLAMGTSLFQLRDFALYTLFAEINAHTEYAPTKNSDFSKGGGSTQNKNKTLE